MTKTWISAVIQRLWRWAKFAGGPTGATALLSVTTLAANVIIFRLMAEDQAGRFALLTALAQTLALLTGLGQGNLLRRLYSLHPIGHFNWPRDLAQTAFIVGLLAAGATVVATYIYRFSLTAALFVFGVTFSLIIITVLSQILGSQRRYIIGSVLLRLPYNLLFLALLPFPFIPPDRQLVYLGISLLGCNTLTVIIGLLSLWRNVPPGAAHVTNQNRAQGVAFMVSGLSYQLPEEGLFSLAGTLLAAPELAAIAAITLLMRPFGMLFDSLNQILLTELARRPQLRYWPMAAALAGLTLAAGLVAVLLGPFAVHLLYNGRYDSFQYIIPLLVLSPALQLAEVLGRAHVNARAPLRQVNFFVLVHTALALAGAVLTFELIRQWGVVGLVAGTALIYIARNLISYSFSLRLNYQTTQGAASLPTH